MGNGKRNKRQNSTEQSSPEMKFFTILPKKWKIYVPVGFVGFIIALAMWFSMVTGSEIVAKYAPLIDAVMEIKFEATTAHLWFEEIIGGDKNEDINKVWSHLDKSEWYAKAMLEGGKSEEGTYIALQDTVFRQKIQKVLEKLSEFRAIANERLQYREQSSIGSDIEQRFDKIFLSFIKHADEVETGLQVVIKRDVKKFRTIQTSLIIFSFIITIFIGFIFYRYELKQSMNLLLINSSNQQLRGSEQQLKASNQQLKLTNHELLQSQQKLSLHVQQTPMGVIQWDLSFKVTEWNKAAEKIFGFSFEEAQGRHAAGLIVPESAKEIANEIWAKLLAQKGGTRSTNENITKNLDIIMCEWYNTPLIDDNNVVIGVASQVLDVSEHHRLQELESRADRLALAGTIAGQVAHDFNNLLGPIMAYPELIRDELPYDHSARAYLDDIENAALKIANINQDLLTMGRRGHYNQEVLNLNQVLLQAIKELELRTKTVVCTKEFNKDLLNIKGGNAQLHRLFSNLFVNAQDAMQDIGEISIKTENYYADDTSIAFNRVSKGEYVKVTISDTGCGIQAEFLGKILDPFFSTKTTDKQRGSGLGLSVVDAVVKDHKGFLDVSSIVGQGTTFYLYFPIVRKDIRKSSIEDSLSGTEKILIVDDDGMQREVAATLLKSLGYKVQAVESGEKAVEFLKEKPQDLIILDMVMPEGIDGTETYKRVIELYPKQKTIILSGFSETDKVFQVQRMGAGAFVRKPITKKIIATAVRTELDRE